MERKKTKGKWERERKDKQKDEEKEVENTVQTKYYRLYISECNNCR